MAEKAGSLVPRVETPYEAVIIRIHELLALESTWSPLCLDKEEGKGVVTESGRQETFDWLRELSKGCHIREDVVAHAGTLLDKLLLTEQIPVTDLKKTILGCVFLSLSHGELGYAEEEPPSASTLIGAAKLSMAVSELCVMERVLLKKLGWNTYVATATDFLDVFYSLLLMLCPDLLQGTPLDPESYHRFLSIFLVRCLSYPLATAQRPVTMALAVLSLDLEVYRDDAVSLFLRLSQATTGPFQVSLQDLIKAREDISYDILGYRVTPLACMMVGAKDRWLARVQNVLKGGVDRPVPSCPPPPASKSGPAPKSVAQIIKERKAVRLAREAKQAAGGRVMAAPSAHATISASPGALAKGSITLVRSPPVHSAAFAVQTLAAGIGSGVGSSMARSPRKMPVSPTVKVKV